MERLKDKHILLGVTGSIATYKAVALASRLVQAGAVVDVIMTEAATKMVQPLSFQAITHREVLTDMWSLVAETEIGHVTLAREADVLLVAPATANTISKMALGFADNYLTTTALALRGSLVVAPAMESGMWEHPATQQHIAALRERSAWIVPPEAGYLASGASGVGRLAGEAAILAMLEQALGPNDLHGLRLVVTAGGTREAIDPVRYVSNYSTGIMGYTLADAAARRGAEVTLISTPVAQQPPVGVEVQQVESTREMQQAVLESLPQADALLMAAAVADYRPATVEEKKIKKEDETELSLRMVRNPDILQTVKQAKQPELTVIGWAAETDDLLKHARSKLEKKGLDMVVANPVPQTFGSDRVEAVLVHAGGHEALEPLSKRDLADRVLDKLLQLRQQP